MIENKSTPQIVIDNKNITGLFNKDLSFQREQIHTLGSKDDYVVIFAGGICQNNCIFCDRALPEKEYVYISFNMLKALIKQNLKLKIDELMIAGSEPFGSQRIFEIFSLAKKNHFKKISVGSSGEYFANSTLVDDVADNGVTTLAIPLYGLNDVHDNIVRRPASFNACIQGFELLKGRTTISIHVHTVLLRQNISEIKKLHEFVRQNLELPFAIIPVRYKPGALPLSKIMPTYKEICDEFKDSNLNFMTVPLCILRYISPVNFKKRMTARVDYEKKILRRVEDDISDIQYLYSRFPVEKAEKCAACALNRYCPGVQPGYIAAYGDSELAPM